MLITFSCSWACQNLRPNERHWLTGRKSSHEYGDCFRWHAEESREQLLVKLHRGSTAARTFSAYFHSSLICSTYAFSHVFSRTTTIVVRNVRFANLSRKGRWKLGKAYSIYLIVVSSFSITCWCVVVEERWYFGLQNKFGMGMFGTWWEYTKDWLWKRNEGTDLAP